MCNIENLKSVRMAYKIGFVCFLMLVFGGVPWKHLFKLIGAVVGILLLIIVIGEFGPE